MTDEELIARLRDWPYQGETMANAAADRIEVLLEQQENATQAMAETSPNWEARCHAIMAALGIDFGGYSEEVPDVGSWFEVTNRRNQELIFTLIAENKRLGQQCEGLMQAGMNNGQALIIAENKLAKAVEALEFYAAWDNWTLDERGVSLVDQDEGKKARAALAELKSTKKEE